MSPPASEPVYTFNGMFVDDPWRDVLKLLIYVAVMAMLVYSRAVLSARGLFRGEFFVLVLFATLGMMVMISANHLLTLYLGLELLSLSLYSLVALQRDSAVATEAAMKYFVLGALASGMLLYGMSMLYGATGTLDIAAARGRHRRAAARRTSVLVFGLVFIVAGIGFKLGAVPFHMWVPDVYHGAPTRGDAVHRLGAQARGVRLHHAPPGAGPRRRAAGGRVAADADRDGGALAGDRQHHRDRADQPQAHARLFDHRAHGLPAARHPRRATSVGYGAGMFYVVIYVLMNLGAFGMILLLSRAGFEAENLDDFKGLNQRSPWYAFLMLLLMFSMAGVPPTVGFYAKLAVLQAVINAGYHLARGGRGAVLADRRLLLPAGGQAHVLRRAGGHRADRPRADVRLLLSVNGLAMLVLGILPER